LLTVYWLGATDYTWNSIPHQIHCKESSATFLVLSVLTYVPWPAAYLPQIQQNPPAEASTTLPFMWCVLHIFKNPQRVHVVV